MRRDREGSKEEGWVDSLKVPEDLLLDLGNIGFKGLVGQGTLAHPKGNQMERLESNKGEIQRRTREREASNVKDRDKRKKASEGRAK